MAPKGGNAKKESGRSKKAENEAKKLQAAEEEKERKEASKWDADAKGKGAKEAKEEKRKELLAAKAERDRLLAEEEAAVAAKPKATPKAGGKKKAAAARPAGPGAIAAGGGVDAVAEKLDRERPEEVESYAATGIDNALDLMEAVNAKTDKASVGQQAAGIEKHPEVRNLFCQAIVSSLTRNDEKRRFKAVYEAYQERELPNIRKDHPGLRLNQYKELLFKQFQKSPENPFNQTVVSYDASKEEKLSALDQRYKEIEERLREKTKDLNLKN
ncbi:hypothetical protein EW145_g3924 [Phellinidium pouzarii]|uniref:DUF1014 domain-containing protein n=1 Tax=Phellinidium pouzarii TaxID=167371 RepID=A0A4S4LAK3_9AGAM|nr:hypothetical protein EW145_g3924 [Phellinidium pouzarii]